MCVCARRYIHTHNIIVTQISSKSTYKPKQLCKDKLPKLWASQNIHKTNKEEHKKDHIFTSKHAHPRCIQGNDPPSNYLFSRTQSLRSSQSKQWWCWYGHVLHKFLLNFNVPFFLLHASWWNCSVFSPLQIIRTCFNYFFFLFIEFSIKNLFED